jgi:hypothetical protein
MLQVTATDTTGTAANGGAAYSLSEMTATPVMVYVVGVSNLLTLAQGATGVQNVTFNTAGATLPDTLTSFSCDKISGTGGTVSEMSCSYASGSISVSSTGLTTVPITISTVPSSLAQLRRTKTMSLAALLGIPLFALAGWIGTRKRPRRNFFRFLGLILLLAGATYAATGCGGSFTETGTQPSGAGLPTGTYLIQVEAQDGAGKSYFAVVPLTVNAN